MGYRFHDSFDVAPRFAFGHGLGYTTFALSELEVTGTGTDLVASVTVTNTGGRAGAEVVQLYVHDVVATVHRPDQELKGFAKVHLEPGASRRVDITLDRRSFAVYDVSRQAWLVEGGVFELRVGRSSRDIAARTTVEIDSDDVVTPVAAPRGPVATDDEFRALLGRPIPAPKPLLPLHLDSTVADLEKLRVGRPLHALIMRQLQTTIGKTDDPTTQALLDAVIAGMPLRALAASSRGALSLDAVERLLSVVNTVAKVTG